MFEGEGDSITFNTLKKKFLFSFFRLHRFRPSAYRLYIVSFDKRMIILRVCLCFDGKGDLETFISSNFFGIFSAFLFGFTCFGL